MLLLANCRLTVPVSHYQMLLCPELELAVKHKRNAATRSAVTANGEGAHTALGPVTPCCTIHSRHHIHRNPISCPITLRPRAGPARCQHTSRAGPAALRGCHCPRCARHASPIYGHKALPAAHAHWSRIEPVISGSARVRHTPSCPVSQSTGLDCSCTAPCAGISAGASLQNILSPCAGGALLQWCCGLPCPGTGCSRAHASRRRGPAYSNQPRREVYE